MIKCANFSWISANLAIIFPSGPCNISRKLVTGSKFDVQFSNLDVRYAFGFAAFDNAQVRHATPDDPLFMVFGK